MVKQSHVRSSVGEEEEAGDRWMQLCGLCGLPMWTTDMANIFSRQAYLNFLSLKVIIDLSNLSVISKIKNQESRLRQQGS